MRRQGKTSVVSMPALALALLFPLVLAYPAFAQNTGEKPLVVTGVGAAVSGGKTTFPVVVIRREEIELMNVRFVPEVLRRVSGLNVVQRGGDGKLATVFLRGGSPAQTLVMIDGVRVNSTTSGEFDFSGITVDDIERIEIAKGTFGSLYGSSALAGVVNIITRKGDSGFGLGVSYLYGARDTQSPVATLSGGGESYGYRLTGQYYDTSGISALGSGGERDGYENASVSGRAGITLGKGLDVEITGRYREDTSGLDGLASDDPNFVRDGKHYLVAFRSAYRPREDWEQVLTLSTAEDELDFSDPDTAVNNARITSGADIVEWRNNFSLPDGSTASLGFEYREEKGENRGVFDRTVDNKAAYLSLSKKHERLSLSGGVRYDEHELAGEEVTYRVAALDEVQEGVRFRASYATGFRAPDMNELFFQGPSGSGNPGLEPETVEQWEVGAEQDYGERSTLSVAYFEQDYDDLIQWVETSPGVWQAVNVPDAEVRGFEAAVLYRATDSLRLNASYTYLDTDDGSGGRLPRRPIDKFTLSGDYVSGGLSLRADYFYVGKRTDDAAGRSLLAYNVLNLGGSYRLWKYATAFVRADNVLGEEYEEAGDFGRPTASVFGGLKITF